MRRLPLSTRYPMGDDITAPTVTDPIEEIRTNVAELIKRAREDAENRKIALIIGGVSALFAAAKLGLVAIPLIRKSRDT